GLDNYHKQTKFGVIFLVFFAVTSSTAAWDFVMSIDTHWFSTMFGWYTLANWHVTGLAVIVLIIVTLKENGYLKAVNASHLHDLDRKSTRLNSSHVKISYAVFCLKKKQF